MPWSILTTITNNNGNCLVVHSFTDNQQLFFLGFPFAYINSFQLLDEVEKNIVIF